MMGEVTRKDKTMVDGKRVSENIYLCPDHVYRWVYEFPMLRNPVIFFTLVKVMGGVMLGVMAFSFLLSVIEGDGRGWLWSYLLTPGFLIFPGILLALVVIGYFIVGVLYGFRYMVLFEMDDKHIVHTQMEKQFKKAQALGWLTTLAGLGAGNATVAWAGIMAGARNSMESEFALVKRVSGRRRRDTIYLVQTLAHNQIYVEKADYDFVWKFLTDRCTRAEIRAG